MAFMQLTDQDIAVYRPWAWIELGDTGLKINYPQGDDQKFRWLKDFRWSLNGTNKGSSVEFTIFEDRSGWNQIWPGIVKKAIGLNGNESLNTGTVRFQWGYAGRDVNNKGIAGFPSGSDPRHYSQPHRMVISKMNMEYVEGGVNYRFAGIDQFAQTQMSTNFGKQSDVTFKQAVNAMIAYLQDKKRAILSENFKANFDALEKDFGQTMKKIDTWPGSGFPFLMTIQSWAARLTPDVVGKGLNKIGPALVVDTIADQEKLVFIPSLVRKPTVNGKAQAVIEIDVNPPEKQGSFGIGKHTAINIRPSINFDQLWAFFPQTSSMGHMDRVAPHNTDKDGRDMSHADQGTPAFVYSGAVDSSRPINEILQAMMCTALGTAGSTGSLYIPIAIEVELLGIPMMDSFDYLCQYVYLRLWNNAFIDDTLKWSREARLPGNAQALIGNAKDIIAGIDGVIGDGFMDQRFSGLYLIAGINHQMTSEGSYTTTLQLIPAGQLENQ